MPSRCALTAGSAIAGPGAERCRRRCGRMNGGGRAAAAASRGPGPAAAPRPRPARPRPPPPHTGCRPRPSPRRAPSRAVPCRGCGYGAQRGVEVSGVPARCAAEVPSNLRLSVRMGKRPQSDAPRVPHQAELMGCTADALKDQ